jgi:hypothetical protein
MGTRGIINLLDMDRWIGTSGTFNLLNMDWNKRNVKHAGHG